MRTSERVALDARPIQRVGCRTQRADVFQAEREHAVGGAGCAGGFSKATLIGTFSPYIRVELQHDFSGQSLAGLAYADLASSGPVYFVPGSPYGSDRVQIGVGTKLRTRALVFGLDYSASTGMGGLQQGVRFTVTAPF
nr:autotransporter domain-containing protein [Pandoraea faecigallinarum]